MTSVSPPLPAGWHPRAREDVVFRRVGEDWVLFDPRAQRIHVLNLSAALVWSFCTGEMEVPAVEAEVRKAFGIALEDPRVEEAVRDFLEAGLLHAP